MNSRMAMVVVAGFTVACSKSNVINTTNNNSYNNITQVVGPTGARVQSPGGAVVDVPANALTTDTELSISETFPNVEGIPMLPAVNGVPLSLRSPVIALEPHGQTFAGDVTITVPHTVSLAAEPGVTPEVWRADPDGAWQQITVLDSVAGRVQVTSRTFSYYAVFTAPAAPMQPMGDCPGGCESDAFCGCAGGTASPCGDGLPSCQACGASAAVMAEQMAWDAYQAELLTAQRCTQGMMQCSAMSTFEVPGQDCSLPVVSGANTENLGAELGGWMSSASSVPRACMASRSVCSGGDPSMVSCMEGTPGEFRCTFDGAGGD